MNENNDLQKEEIADYWKTYPEYADMLEVAGYFKGKTEISGMTIVNTEMLKQAIHIIEYFYEGYEKRYDTCCYWEEECNKLREKIK